MRLHRLTVTAFGPFAGREEVDFDALGEAGLFLFTGPTGAGKTSILDAVCFALYGQVPGARRGASLRSEHATADVATEVTLELTLRGRRIQVTRSPSWERPKRRGAGTTTQPAKVLVAERSCEDWRPLSTRLDEAGHLLAQLVGLSMAQFCQVVLLPQGEFAEFLRADADRRRDLLESLFGTAAFAAVEAWLVEARRDTAQRLRAHDETLAQVLARVAEVTDLDAVPSELGPDQAAAWLSRMRTGASARAVRAADVEEAVRVRRATAQAAVSAAEQLEAAQRRHHALMTRYNELLAEAPVVSGLVLELDAARRAAPVVPVWREAVRLEQSLAQAVGQVADVRQAVGAYGSDIDQAEFADPRRLRTRAGMLRAETGTLRRLLDDEARADELAQELSELERTVVALGSRSAGLCEWLTGAPMLEDRLKVAVDQARHDRDRLPSTEADVASATARLVAGRRRDELAAELALQRDRLRAVIDEAQRARAHALDVRERRLLGMAAELARELVDGQPCAVCGSAEHPLPALARDGAVGRNDEAAAAAAAEAAEARRAAAQAEIATTEVALAEVRVVAGDVPQSELGDALVRARAVCEEALSGAAGCEFAEAELRKFRQDHEAHIQLRMELDAETERLRGRASSVSRQLDDLRKQLAAARGKDLTVKARAERLSRLAEHCESLTESLFEVERLGAELNDARRRAACAAAACGFPDVSAVPAHVRDEARVAELEEEQARHRSELASVEGLLADRTVQDAAQQPPPDVAAAKAALTDVEAELEQAVGDKRSAQRCAAALARLNRELTTLLAARAPLATRHATVDHLSRLVEGKTADNRLRMSLSAYVLAARLEQVAEAASQRLLVMSSGRYSLLHTDAPGSGRAGRGGLHLRVLDAWTGSERDPATLSGGESFAASLALALGLADIVTAEAGGSLLETLFVDEGFGSLDDETLDDVMSMLDSLRNGGRVVGIVSHVADLRQRIPTQLQVVKGRCGSTVRQQH